MEKIKALIYKEYIKTRLTLVVSLVTTLGIVGAYALILQTEIRTNGAVSEVTNHLIGDARTNIFYQYMPAIVGLGMALTQFVPEASYGRLKLTLHLPMNETATVLTMSAFGWVTLLGIGLAGTAEYWMWNSKLMPPTIVMADYLASVPWALGSFATYNYGVALSLDTTRRGRLSWGAGMVLTTLAVAWLPSGAPESLPLAALLTLPTATIPLHCAQRYRNGVR